MAKPFEDLLVLNKPKGDEYFLVFQDGVPKKIKYSTIYNELKKFIDSVGDERTE